MMAKTTVAVKLNSIRERFLFSQIVAVAAEIMNEADI